MKYFFFFFWAYLLLWLVPFVVIAVTFVKTRQINQSLKKLEDRLSKEP